MRGRLALSWQTTGAEVRKVLNCRYDPQRTPHYEHGYATQNFDFYMRITKYAVVLEGKETTRPQTSISPFNNTNNVIIYLSFILEINARYLYCNQLIFFIPMLLYAKQVMQNKNVGIPFVCLEWNLAYEMKGEWLNTTGSCSYVVIPKTNIFILIINTQGGFLFH